MPTEIPDFIIEGLANGSIQSAVVVSNGAPCRCGPGFCASASGVGYIGTCGGSRAMSAPDCPRCGAPHQSDAGCWLCDKKGNYTESDAAGSAIWLRALRLGVRGEDLFRRQDVHHADGRWVTLDDVLDEIERGQVR